MSLLSRFFSNSWPLGRGEVVEVEVGQSEHAEAGWGLYVCYKFYAGDDGRDGPYTGESYWEPTFSKSMEEMEQIASRIHIGEAVQVRYRPDNPSVSKLNIKQLVEGQRP